MLLRTMLGSTEFKCNFDRQELDGDHFLKHLFKLTKRLAEIVLVVRSPMFEE